MPATLDSSAVWLITGCSSGLGKSFAQAVYNLGHNVVVTARNTSTLSYLPDDSPRVLKIKLDVTSKESIINAVNSTVEKYGRLDVVINNAGYGLLGDSESIPEEDARMEIETLFWGPVFLMQEAVRVFREVNKPRHNVGGTIVNISSMGGTITVGGNAFYHAGKFALEGFSKAMAQEMKPEWNIRFLLVGPGGVRTNFMNTPNSGLKLAPRHPAYNTGDDPLSLLLGYTNSPDAPKTWSDPDKCARLLVDTVLGTTGKELPRMLLMGADSVQYVKLELEKQLKEIEDWTVESKSVSPGSADLSFIG
ncbi:3-oxoacyl-[acyl-carrier-protein] reductase, putative [Talaromyces stipitatus ATCC 10500]|uniref:3-oxoacyl-[acyl-carrier-protein] reductase, putative n=1 Tax=Talaromyces stipitatus (strain ATCC 10500 / CBS 375.48 / QM 6759 / NRRL 1006) TaxID=441959 RepID=B8LUS9_TALSN|nr:3-oxoacyl-[acyl-carrier-protein] reductase, putative [Talaromyces stipitatus ATCC 10500]EED23936.1 3-oxoacyl-[acyl-carrier-protein] reductase, putative [Talaromyces stipitatus ATCC 10500]